MRNAFVWPNYLPLHHQMTGGFPLSKRTRAQMREMDGGPLPPMYDEAWEGGNSPQTPNATPPVASPSSQPSPREPPFSPTGSRPRKLDTRRKVGPASHAVVFDQLSPQSEVLTPVTPRKKERIQLP